MPVVARFHTYFDDLDGGDVESLTYRLECGERERRLDDDDDVAIEAAAYGGDGERFVRLANVDLRTAADDDDGVGLALRLA